MAYAYRPSEGEATDDDGYSGKGEAARGRGVIRHLKRKESGRNYNRGKAAVFGEQRCMYIMNGEKAGIEV